MVAEAETQSEAARWAAAAALWEHVVACNPVHGSHWDRLAEACFELGDYRRAQAAYERVLDLGGWGGRLTQTVFSGEVAYRIACCQARLGDRESAVAALRRALDLGFRDLGRPRTDELWESPRGDRSVREMLGIPDPGGLPRDEGWRADISFLAREIKRRGVAPFRAVSEPDFDSRVSLLADGVPGLSDAQIIAGMLRLLRPLADGHAFIAPAEGDKELNRVLPVKFYRFGEGLFVTAAAPAYRQLLGAEVLRVGEHPAGEVLAALEPLISRDNDQQVRWLGPEVLPWAPMLHALGLTGDPDSVTLTVRFPDETTGTVAVGTVPARSRASTRPSRRPRTRRGPARRAGSRMPRRCPARCRLTCASAMSPTGSSTCRSQGLVYFQFNGVGDRPEEPLAAFCDRLFGFIDSHPVAGLVIDLRWNGGGNTLLVQPLLHHLIGCAKVRRPGGLFVIIGRGTFSAAQNTATAIERETSAIFVGEPSGSRPNFIGETMQFELPYSKTIANVSDLYWQTSWPVDQRPWIAPEIYAPPTFAAYRQNRDVAMEAVLACHQHLAGGRAASTGGR